MDRKIVVFFLVVAFLAATPSLALAQDNWAPYSLVERTVNCLNGLGPCDQAVLDFLAQFAGKPGPQGRPGRDGRTPTGPELVAIIRALVERGDLKLPAGQVDENTIRGIVSRMVAEELRRQPQQPATQPATTATPTPGAPVTVPPAVTPAPNQGPAVPWWAILIVVLALAALLATLAAMMRRIRIRNNGRFYIGRYLFARRRIQLPVTLGPALWAEKRVSNNTRTRPDQRRWYAPTLWYQFLALFGLGPLAAGPGDLLQFRLEWRNEGWTPVPTTLIRLQDTLEGPGVREGAVILTVGREPDAADIVVPNAQVDTLFGTGLTLANVPGAPPKELGARTSVYIRYKVRIPFPGDEEGADAEGPPPAN